MNKSIITNSLSIILLLIGHGIENRVLSSAGLFAFSGSVTNCIAIHMIFEKVPGLYGSGVIPNRFEDFKLAVKSLVMSGFFTEKNLEKIKEKNLIYNRTLELSSIIDQVDFSPTFDSLVDVILTSSFGGMVAMLGGTGALQQLRTPFIEKMKQSVSVLSQSEEVDQAIKNKIDQSFELDTIRESIESVIDERLDELTPGMVKEIVAAVIKEHLDWLVVWGGFFGGLIGLIISALS